MRLIIYLDKLTSTMDIAHILAEKGYPHGTVIVAEEQTQGRGRFERKWYSPKGGLWFSIILRSKDLLIQSGFLGIIIGVSVLEVLEKFLKDIELNFKWPNDIEYNGKKVAGILIESIYEKELKYIIVGVGINLLVDPNDIKDLKAFSLRDYITTYDKNIVLIEVLEKLETNLNGFPHNWKEIFNFYKNKFPYIGKGVFIRNKNQKAKVIDMTEDGGIVLLTDNKVQKYEWGGVSLEFEGTSH
ncbi:MULTISPECIES: biotin--[acetyl-CoA-carboxylase] ligase [Dictyoglomus]|jgi:BirA family biotin operon repressor/biotin-[acetyl-CoA-carboxylase] ligase|uniref:biotin--[acetyl-CoA-carboxylase] ligase n=1 Tax=Dictyoglomus TaxID=13 RepID=UPI000CCDD6A2|nr:MAG: biotin--[acetyl-CoA-carboxylase] ligase [Dictyoglomus turgidum]